MTVKELAEALALMRFSGDRLRLVAIDKDVRDFLVSLVTARHGKA